MSHSHIAVDKESESGKYDALHNINKLTNNDDDVINADNGTGAVYTNIDINLDYDVSSCAQSR